MEGRGPRGRCRHGADGWLWRRPDAPTMQRSSRKVLDVIAFDGCSLDLAGVELRRDGVRVHLEPQVFDVLAFLVTHRDRVVDQDRAARPRLGQPVRQRLGTHQSGQGSPPGHR